MTHPAAETKSVGLQADAQLAAFFALLYKMRRDEETPFSLPGLIRNRVLP